MVRYKPLEPFTYYRTPREYGVWIRKHYWKIQNPRGSIKEPDERNDRVDSIVRSHMETYHDYKDFRRMRSRLFRGMMLYEGCTIQELRKFCKDRGLSAWRFKKSVKRRMISALEQADDDIVFDKFLDLPAELRVLIYEHSFESFEPSRGRILPPPPISQITGTSLSISGTTWSISSTTLNISGDQSLKKELRVIDAGPVELLERINSITIEDRLPLTRRCHYTVSITADGAKATIPPDQPRAEDFREALVLQQTRINELVSVFQERDGKVGSLRLERGDGKLLWKFFEESKRSISPRHLQ